jgi:hypothetical protein
VTLNMLRGKSATSNMRSGRTSQHLGMLHWESRSVILNMIVEKHQSRMITGMEIQPPSAYKRDKLDYAHSM